MDSFKDVLMAEHKAGYRSTHTALKTFGLHKGSGMALMVREPPHHHTHHCHHHHPPTSHHTSILVDRLSCWLRR